MSNISNLSLASMDFDTILSDLKTYFKSQEKWSDYNFDGEGTSTALIMEILSAITYKQNVYLNAALNETFLPTSKTRNAVVRKAKMMNYRIKSSNCATAQIKLTFDTGSDYPAQIVIPKYTNFSATDASGESYNFITNQVYYCTPDSDYNYEITIDILQGEHLDYTWNVTADQKLFTIPNTGVDINRMIMNVKYSSSDTNWTPYIESQNIVNLNEQSCVYFINEGTNETFDFYFGDDVYGKAISNGNIIKLDYITTSGRNGNDLTTFTLLDTLDYTCEIETVQNSANGYNLETIASIKNYAPKYMASQNRAVNSEDFEAIIYSKFPEIDSISCWGGEENNPVKYGKVCISAITTSNYNLSDTLKEDIENEFNSNVIIGSKQLYWIDSQIINVIPTLQVFYDSSTSLSKSDMELIIRYGLSNYNQYLRGFNKTLEISGIMSYLKNLNNAFTDVIITNKLSYKLEDYSDITNTSIDLQNALTEGSITSNRYFNGDNILCYVADNGKGVINEYTNNNGTNVINEGNIGTVDYTEGTISLNNISISSILGGSNFVITATPNSSKIVSEHNTILNIDQESAVINMVA